MTGNQETEIRDTGIPDLRSIISGTVLDRSRSIVDSYKVNFDNECSFCRKNRQIYFVNEEYEHPEPTFIKRLPTSVAALSYDQDHTGRTVVILRDHEVDLNYFMKTKLMLFLAFMEDVSSVVDAIERTCLPDRINYAIYMNRNEHLHVHVIPRYRSEGEAFCRPPVFPGRNSMSPDFDYRSLALKIRKNIRHRPSELCRYMEKLINEGLPP